MRIWWTTAYYELLKYSRKKTLILILIVLPLVLIYMLGSAFDTEIKPAKVIVYNADRGELRASVDAFWSNDEIKPYVRFLAAKEEGDVQPSVTESESDYGVVIPADYSSRVLKGETVSWRTYSGRYVEKNLAVESVIDSYLTELNMQMSAQAILGPETGSEQAAVGEPDAAEPFVLVGMLGGDKNQIFRSVSAMQYYAATYLIMFLLYGGMLAAIELLNQHKNGTLQRMFTMPFSFIQLVLGIVTGSFLVAALQAIIIVLFTKFVYDVNWGTNYGWLFLISLLTTAVGAGIAIIIASFAKTVKTTQTVFGIVAFSMTFVSGGMIADIDVIIGDASKWTVNHWANEGLRAIMNGSSWSGYSQEVAILAMIAAVLSVFAMIRLPKVVKQHA
ncbi:ABC transporter permease [Paenibacillus harenae]|uniref:ABC-2 type transport system permease protein n=1 Tax=Paenibacillus harenae TaxID=306543 RepID=A0ABT9U3A4_PAEHA|nr:ABC transporter permease [Paenibacillus harenae]MDQ0112934.1 ABC-2 type transport system permease protein [Paenibacillus harenae]